MRILLLSLAIIIVNSFNSFAQAPANDICANAITIAVNGGYVNASNTNTVTDGPTPNCGGTTAIKDIWYKFVYTGGNVTVETQLGTLTDTRLAIYGSCGGTMIVCNDDFGGTYRSSATLTCTQLTLNNTYYIQVGGYNALVGAFTIQVTSAAVAGCMDPVATNYNACATTSNGSCTYTPPPTGLANDVCANAIPITLNSGYVNSTNVGTTSDGPNPSCGGSTLIKDVWYSFVYTGGTVIVETQLGTCTDTRLAVYNSCGGTMLACNDDVTGSLRSSISLSCTQLAVGTSYKIQAGGYNGLTGTFTIQVSATGILGCTDPMATNYLACSTQNNGSCVYPVLTAQFNQAPSGTNCLNIQYTSTSSGNITGYDWSFPGGTPSNSAAQNPIVTYPSAGTYSATLIITDATTATSTATNNNVQVQTGQIVTVDITPDANPTQTTWKMFDGNNVIVAQGTSNDLTFCINNTCHRFEIYDSAGNGLTGTGNYKVYVNGIQVAGGAVFGSRDIRDINCPAGTSCNNVLVASLGLNDVPFDNSWYTFTPAANGQYRISTCGLAACDNKIWVYDYCVMANFDESNAATYTYNDDFCGVQAQTDVFMTAGSTYYVRIGSSSGACAGTNYQALFEYVGAITGCMDVLACNYNPLAAVAGPCYYNGSPNCNNLGPDLEVVLSDMFNSLYLTTITSTDACLVNEGCLQGTGTRQILRFTTRIANIGNQDYFIGVPNASNPQFEYDPCHNHYHYEGYAEYLLFDQTGTPMPQIGFKNGFCVLDLSCPSGITAQYSCGNMGITAGCADYYSSGLACQWVDITDVPAGDYYLVVRTNWDQSPDRLGHYELRYDNNWAQVCIHFERNASNGIINFTKTITACPVIEDCLGIPFGDNYTDCAGNCPGTVKSGDIDNDGYLNPLDEHLYGEAAVYGGTAVTPCKDLNSDGEITVADASYLGACLHAQQDLGVNPLQYTSCPWDPEFIESNENVTLGVTNLNTTEQYFDVYIVNPQNEVIALQLDFSGALISSVQNLLPTSTWNAHSHAEVGGNTIAVTSEIHTEIPINLTPLSILRVYYSSLTSNTVCVSNIVDVMNEQNYNVLTNYGICQSVIANVDANFTASSTSICAGQSVTFTDTSTGNPTGWSWSFPGGTPSTSTAQNPVVTYNTAGTQNVTLIASNSGSTDTELKTAYIVVGASVQWFYDADGDGYGNSAVTVWACDAPLNFVAAGNDCDNNNAAIHPNATEVCNGIDDNCNGSIDEGFDLDNDGFTTCDGDCDDNNSLRYPGAFELCNGIDEDCDLLIDENYDVDGDGYTACNGDCNDNNAAVKPGATEICNGIDDNCNGSTDEGFDLDGDGFTTCNGDCNDANPNINPGVLEACNGADDNCNGITDEGFDEDGDGFSVCFGDCDDNNPLIYPGADELCNGIDDNCNALIDEGFDNDGDGVSVCAGDCNDNNASIYPGAIELCNGIDDNCDGNIDENYDNDGDGFTTCVGDCNDNNAAVNPGAAEVCNGIDDNCNGSTDEGFDIDGDGFTTCGGDCNDNSAAVFPGAPEQCNAIDDNCNGSIDEGFDADGDGYTTCNGDCDDNNSAINPGAIELCNGLDDNCNGQTDEGFDVDGDGYTTCEGDCNDANASIHPGQTESCNSTDDNCNGIVDEGFDADGDGYTTCSGDCNDLNANVNPGATELCNGIDDNCNGTVDEDADADGDGFTNCSGDCNDNSASIHPGAAELCNGLDDNCNGSIDEGFDVDGDGYSVCAGDCNDNNANIHPGAIEACNNADDNCNGSVDEGFDIDGDGYTSCNGDCNDNNAAVRPGAAEACNGIDDNCNGSIDEGFDMDGDGYTTCMGDCNDNNSAVRPNATEVCNGIDDNCNTLIDEGFDQDGDGYTSCGGDCNDNNAARNPGAVEICNSIDDNCNGQVDENAGPWYYQDFDGDGYGNPNVSMRSCVPVNGYVTNNLDCFDTFANRHPGVIEMCNAIDDDCNGLIDDNCSSIPNDFYVNAITLIPSAYGTCNSFGSSLSGATASPESNSTAITGQDVWFKFVATNPGVRIRVLTSAFNAVVELQDNAFNTLDVENIQNINGNESLNFGFLTVGNTYYVSVRNFNSATGSGSFFICLESLPSSGCDSPVGPYTLCSTFKAQNTSAYIYRFNFTSTSNGITYTREQGSVNCILRTVDNLPHGHTFNVRIDCVYSVSLGNSSSEWITVVGPTTCLMTTSPDPEIVLRSNQTCPSTRQFGSLISTLSIICGISNYGWEFQFADLSAPPFYVNSGTSYITSITAANGFTPNKTYNVRMRATYTNGYTSAWGPVRCLKVGNNNGMAMEDDSDILENDATRFTEMSINLFPNPGRGDVLNIQIPQVNDSEVSVRIFDAMGHLIWSNRFTTDGYLNTQIVFDTQLAAGLYLVEVGYDNMSATEKLLIQK